MDFHAPLDLGVAAGSQTLIPALAFPFAAC